MKKITKLLIPFIVLLSCVNENENEKNVIANFEFYTGLHKNYQIRTIKFKANQGYVEADISKEDAKMLKERYHFISADSLTIIRQLSKKSFTPFELADLYDLDSNHEYYMKFDYDIYGYFFIGISKDSTSIFTCENFPE